jgi:hypothetical protein
VLRVAPKHREIQPAPDRHEKERDGQPFPHQNHLVLDRGPGQDPVDRKPREEGPNDVLQMDEVGACCRHQDDQKGEDEQSVLVLAMAAKVTLAEQRQPLQADDGIDRQRKQLGEQPDRGRAAQVDGDAHREDQQRGDVCQDGGPHRDGNGLGFGQAKPNDDGKAEQGVRREHGADQDGGIPVETKDVPEQRPGSQGQEEGPGTKEGGTPARRLEHAEVNFQPGDEHQEDPPQRSEQIDGMGVGIYQVEPEGSEQHPRQKQPHCPGQAQASAKRRHQKDQEQDQCEALEGGCLVSEVPDRGAGAPTQGKGNGGNRDSEEQQPTLAQYLHHEGGPQIQWSGAPGGWTPNPAIRPGRSLQRPGRSAQRMVGWGRSRERPSAGAVNSSALPQSSCGCANVVVGRAGRKRQAGKAQVV